MIGEYNHEPVTRTGDVWILGNHRLICGDCGDQKVITRLFGSKKMFDTTSLLFTSPPYDNQRSYTVGSISWTDLMKGMITAGTIPTDENTQIIINLGVVHRNNEWQPYWNEWMEWMRTVGWRRFGVYIWHMGAGLPGDWNGRFAPDFEFLFHFNKKARRPNKIVKCASAGRPTETDKRGGLRMKNGADATHWTHAGRPIQDWRIPDAVVEINRQATSGIEREHPAVFPPQLPEFIIKAYSNEGEIVYEPFSGSGTTIIAAENVNRHCYAVDIAPEYIDVAIRRWHKLFPGAKRAILEADEKTFEQVADERGVQLPDDNKFRPSTGIQIHNYEPHSTLEDFMS